MAHYQYNWASVSPPPGLLTTPKTIININPVKKFKFLYFRGLLLFILFIEKVAHENAKQLQRM